LREFSSYSPPPIPSLVEVSDEQSIEVNVDLIRDWMTIPYISKTYRVHPRILFDALGLSPRGNEEKSLAQLNEEYSRNHRDLSLNLSKP
jgi:hypothetical protein